MRSLLIYDSDKVYIRRLSGTLIQKKLLPFNIYGFSNSDALLNHISKMPPDVAIVSDSLYEEVKSQLERSLVIILKGSKNHISQSGLPSVSKYLSVQDFSKAILNIYSRYNKAEPTYTTELSKLICVYSPISRCGKTLFSIALGERLSKNSSCIYISLDTVSAIPYLIGQRPQKSLSDLIYLYKNGAENIALASNSCTYSLGNMSYIPPASVSSDMYETGSKSVSDIIKAIRQASIFNYLVVDIGNFPGDIYDLLESSDQIYVPTRDDTVSKAKMSSFRTELNLGSHNLINDKLRYVNLPYVKSAGDLFSLELTAFGAAADELIEKDGL